MTGTQILITVIGAYFAFKYLRWLLFIMIVGEIVRELRPVHYVAIAIAVAAVAFVGILHAHNTWSAQRRRYRPNVVIVANDIGQPSDCHIIRWPISPQPQPRRASLWRALSALFRPSSPSRY